MLALVDGDIVAYRAAAITEDSDLGLAIWHTENTLKRILEDVNASSHRIFLTGSDNFRYRLYPAYKANRIGKPRPKHWGPIKEHLITQWNADLTHGCEADDAIGVAVYEAMQDTVVCSIDKDLQMLAGDHYNFVKREVTNVNETQANYNFWKQMLTGDRSDNIPGITGIGTVRAGRMLAVPESPERVVLEAYLEQANIVQFNQNAACLWIWRKQNDVWNASEKLGLDQTL